MCGLLLGLLLPHGDEITLGGYGYNLALATLGNILGGAGFVAGMLPQKSGGFLKSPATLQGHFLALTRTTSSASGMSSKL
jgi:hypothetical protein